MPNLTPTDTQSLLLIAIYICSRAEGRVQSAMDCVKYDNMERKNRCRAVLTYNRASTTSTSIVFLVKVFTRTNMTPARTKVTRTKKPRTSFQWQLKILITTN